ncbi:MAG: hypothetical protein WCY19_00775 [Candidatus Gastranaerophilaceae bacterium]
MYVEIKENKLLSWCEKPYLDYEYVDIGYETFDPEKYSVIGGVLTDISETEDYKTKISDREKAAKKAELQLQLDELDKKRVRAISEPALREEQNGQTWLEYYTEQIMAIREQIAAL